MWSRLVPIAAACLVLETLRRSQKKTKETGSWSLTMETVRPDVGAFGETELWRCQLPRDLNFMPPK